MANLPPASIDGAWVVTFTLDHSGSQTRPPVNSRLVGTIVLVRNRWPERRHRMGIATVPYYGVYDVDFNPFGFDPRTPGELPVAAVDSTPQDSIGIELQPGGADHGSVYLSGRALGDSIIGNWTQQLMCCGSSGTFAMRRRQ